ncbi:MAG: recombinase family protein [Lachnospiraceae bacterium]|nr:recombinase family protein [Lachnospiraceae bacterium]
MNINDNFKKWMAADYVRLSKEDGDKEESDSINNQKALIQNYVQERPDLYLCGHYGDDGYTGVNFHRPGFEKMMEDISKGQINCVIVKDLSRFGRNYIEVGRYIERIFPALGIRFIAINDAYDSLYNNSSADQLLLPFKNLINDAYSRDISIKVRSHLDIKRKRGEFVSPAVPYGYKRAESDKHQLIVDEPAARIVKQIFSKKLTGLSNQQIAESLNERKVSTPLVYKQEHGLWAKNAFQIYGNPKWYGTTVRRILENEVYTGTLLQGKTNRPNYKIRISVERPKEAWFRTENSHEAIISRNDFNLVQNILDTDTYHPAGQKTVYPFSGLISCGNCHQTCRRRQSSGKKGTYHYYGCYLKNHRACCKGYAISETSLIQAVMTVLHLYVDDLSNLQQVFDFLEKLPARHNGSQELSQELIHMEKNLKNYQRLVMSLHEDYHDGLLDQIEYLDLKAAYREQIAGLTDAMEAATKRRNVLISSFAEASTQVEQFRDYLESPSLDRRMLVSMVEKIYIYPKNRVHVIFRFSDEFERFLGLLPKDSSLADYSKNLVRTEVLVHATQKASG